MATSRAMSHPGQYGPSGDSSAGPAPKGCSPPHPSTRAPFVAVATGVPSVKSNRFGDPAPADVTAPRVAAPMSQLRTDAALAFGFVWRKSATAPATCGVAIDVPLNWKVAASLVFHADVTALPGA